MRLLITGGSGFIGTHFVRKADSVGVEWRNIDIHASVADEFHTRRDPIDIMFFDELRAVVLDFAPTHVVHLAARTDTHSNRLRDYDVNTTGTLNVVRASAEAGVSRFVYTSSQFVVRPDVVPRSDTDFDPHTTYGHSKAIGELLTRAGLSDDVWTIVRPTNVWGPWHPRYGDEFLRVLQRGLYFHPAGRDARRTYGYVTNVVEQMWAALTMPAEAVAGHVFYLGDPPIFLREWTDAFSRALVGRDVRTLPRAVLRAIAAAGDVASFFGIRAPLTTSRFRSMTEDYVTPVAATVEVLGTPSMTLEQGVDETVRWLREARA